MRTTGRLLKLADRPLRRLSKRYSRVNLYPWMSDALAQHASGAGARVLSIGAGGETEDVLRRAGVPFESIDVDPARDPDTVGSVEDLGFVEDASVDVVVCMEVLEHVQRPERGVRELHRVLKPGGVLIGSTPFMLGVHDAPRDYRRFTAHGLELLFDGFESIDLRARNRYFASVAALLLRPLALKSRADTARLVAALPLLLGVLPALGVLDVLWPRDDATTGYFFVFAKPR
jgi:SAM-dependent methyltransferase